MKRQLGSAGEADGFDFGRWLCTIEGGREKGRSCLGKCLGCICEEGSDKGVARLVSWWKVEEAA